MVVVAGKIDDRTAQINVIHAYTTARANIPQVHSCVCVVCVVLEAVKGTIQHIHSPGTAVHGKEELQA